MGICRVTAKGYLWCFSVCLWFLLFVLVKDRAHLKLLTVKCHLGEAWGASALALSFLILCQHAVFHPQTNTNPPGIRV